MLLSQFVLSMFFIFRPNFSLVFSYKTWMKSRMHLCGKLFFSFQEYFTNLQESLTGVSPDSIFNYDETNLVDDPKKLKVIVPRGLNRIEKKMEHSKTSTRYY